ncbi:MAG: M13 family peptidase, partial [Dokdonella sp.]
MKACLATLLCVGILSACSGPQEPQRAATPAVAATAPAPVPAAPVLVSGIEKGNMDTATRAQDDFYRHVNGHWLDVTEIPADKPSYGSFTKLSDDSIENLRKIIDESAKADPATVDIDQRKIGDLYASFLDEPAIEATGVKPLEATFARIDALKNSKDVAILMGQFGR